MAKKQKTPKKMPMLSLREIEESILANLGPIVQPVIILDTGGLIDIVQSAKVTKGGNESDPKYCDAKRFLTGISKEKGLLITPGVYEEIMRHLKVKLNSYESELPDCIRPLIVDGLSRFNLARKVLQMNGKSDDEIRYDSVLACNAAFERDSKKGLEDYSLADGEIVYFAALMAAGTIGGKRNYPVEVITSDAHISEGIKKMKQLDGYASLRAINTRRKS
jgi:hypothetical protein